MATTIYFVAWVALGYGIGLFAAGFLLSLFEEPEDEDGVDNE